MKKFKSGEAIIFDPKWDVTKVSHPISKGEIVYFLTDIPNCPGHCIVARHEGQVVTMVHPEDFRKANEDEL